MLAESCQLLRRHWSITYSDGRTEVVDGEGVIGEQPTFAPGDLYQYSSCTMFDKEEYCQMEGYFLMKYLNTGEQYTYYRLHVARKFGRELNLAVWRSTFTTAKLKSVNISYLHTIYVWWSLTELPNPIFLQWQFGAQPPNLILPIFLAIQYVPYVYMTMWSALQDTHWCLNNSCCFFSHRRYFPKHLYRCGRNSMVHWSKYSETLRTAGTRSWAKFSHH